MGGAASLRRGAAAWALVLGLGVGAPLVAAADGMALAGASRCRFVPLEGWLPDVRWNGACRDGRAEGLGTLREIRAGKVTRIFFGRLEKGEPRLGAIEQPDGYKAGRFEAGRVVGDGDRNVLIEAFDEASKAARHVADVYEKGGNAGSARLYRDKARKLAEQLD